MNKAVLGSSFDCKIKRFISQISIHPFTIFFVVVVFTDLPTGYASSGLQVLPDSFLLLISNTFNLTNSHNNSINNNNNLSNDNNSSNNRLQPVENTKWFFATTLRRLELAKRFESLVCLFDCLYVSFCLLSLSVCLSVFFCFWLCSFVFPAFHVCLFIKKKT